jgi:hypothetical protein
VRGNVPNDITPMAWKMPSLRVRRGLENDPLLSAGTMNP